MKPHIAGVGVPEQDGRAIVTPAAEVEHAQQHALPDAFLDVFWPDALWTLLYGTALTGID